MSISMPEKKPPLTGMKIILSFMVVFKITIINYVSFRFIILQGTMGNMITL